jgi:RNA-directed DNA polymerase
MPRPSARHEVACHDRLHRAWVETKRRSKLASWEKRGPDGYSITNILHGLDRHLRNLSAEIRAGYQFGSLQAHFIVKPNGQNRVICVPSILDRIVQRSILGFLSETDRCRIINDISFGYVKREGRNQVEAAKSAAKHRDSQPWALNTDITAFFDQIDRARLKAAVRRKVRFPSLHDLLYSAIECEVRETDKRRKQRLKQCGIVKGRGIRQGMPLSPFFSNIYLNDLDRKLQKSGVRAIRYADDLLLLFDSRQDAEDALAWISEELNAIGLEVPPLSDDGKTRIVQPGEPVEFLGASIEMAGGQYRPLASERLFNSIRNRYIDLASEGSMRSRDMTLFDLQTRLSGLTSSLSAAYYHCYNHDALERKLHEWHAQAIAKVLRREFNLDIAELTPRQQFILGLPHGGVADD